MPASHRAPHWAANLERPLKGDWPLSPATLVELDEFLERERPRSIVELGSGLSTLVLARYAARHGASATVFEHDPRFARATRKLLRGFAANVDLRVAPLVGSPPVYDSDVPPFDFALIDGPPARLGGRDATFDWLVGSALPGAEVWLDDADRVDELSSAIRWSLKWEWDMKRARLPHGLIRLREQPFRREVDASGITITVLTGGRPDLLFDTLTSLPVGMLSSADRVVALNNGGDEMTHATLMTFLEDQPLDCEVTILDTPKMLPLGEAMGVFPPHVESPLWFHLEDDWRLATTHDGWLDDAKSILADRPDVFQVRCRHASEPVMSRHQSEGTPIAWVPEGRWGVADSAHLTMNPSLMRTSEFERLWPCSGEKEAQREAARLGMRAAAQLSPGAFHHTGALYSLREVTGG